MRTPTRILFALCAAALAGLAPRGAAAQLDVSPRLPNVLLLLQTSGSMEYLIAPDPTDPTGVRLITPENVNAPMGSTCQVVSGTQSGTNWNPMLATANMNRWASLVSVLTGSFATNAFGCEDLKRNTSKFVSEYTYPGAGNPYDYNYMLDWHRIYSNGCTVGVNTTNPPIVAGQNWTSWPSTVFDYHTSAGTCASNAANCCNWTGQNNDGILDVFGGLVRFGLMTMDSFPDPSTGALPGTPPPGQTDPPGAMKGMWSYFHGWQTWSGGAPATTPPKPSLLPSPPAGPAVGNPNACATPAFFEVGARNSAAPPWEGPLMPFGNPLSDTNITTNNANIKQAVLAMRPYGAAPLSAMLADAYEFLFQDNTLDLATGTVNFGPYQDPYWLGGCRKTIIILLIDGEPNLDLRGPTGQCDATPADPNYPGNCPYLPASQILTNLRTMPPSGNMNQDVFTYVVGFSGSTPTSLPAGETSCSQLNVNPADNPNDCTNPLPGLADCCTLQELAWAGSGGPTGNGPIPGQTSAFFANSPQQVRAAIAALLSQIIGAQTDRTAPVYAPAGPGNAQGKAPASSYQFAASFDVTSTQTGATTGTPWAGNLVRERYSCNANACNGAALPCPVATSTLGDDFGANLDSTSPGRSYFTVVGATDINNNVDSDWTMRPYIPADDGFGTYVPASNTPSALMTDTTFPSTMSAFPAAFGLPSNAACLSAFNTTTPATCTADILNWEIGVTNSGLPPSLSPAISRNPSSPYCTSLPVALPKPLPDSPTATCHKLGAIFHSTPVVVGPPGDLIRDDTYTAYANTASVASEPIMLYTATIDGQLHAFKVSASVNTDSFTIDSLANNELWSFFPPAVLQHILPNYNTGGANLLDGTPVIADVPGRVVASGAAPVFERTANSAVQWHRVLVSGGGQAGGFYYALDITNPAAPQFLWQISTDGFGNPMFGATTPTPAIAVVAVTESNVRTQVPVAILPGGSGTLTPCTATNTPAAPPHTNVLLGDPNNPNNPPTSTTTFFKVPSFNAPPLRCWNNQAPSGSPASGGQHFGNGTTASGNSVTIVRIDTGQVLANFTGTGYFGAVGFGVQVDTGNHSAGPNSSQPLTSPMTGIPVVYPADTGQVADRAYIGDADGQVWRFDFSIANPAQWTVSLAWDAYLDANTSARESIETAPVLSRDAIGNMVILFSTGDQNVLTSTSTDNRVWSLTETPLNHTTSQNWMIPMPAGTQHVTGPMELFNNALYFATYVPPSTAGVCAPNTANIWGVDYLQHSSTGAPNGTVPGNPGQQYIAAASNSVIYGVSVAETPSCDSSQTSTDSYFGSHTSVTGASQSQYRIMWQTGAGTGVTNTSVNNEVGLQHAQNMSLPAPGLATKIDSWAAIVE
jgi:type IV pilus assembly protein PilY1